MWHMLSIGDIELFLKQVASCIFFVGSLAFQAWTSMWMDTIKFQNKESLNSPLLFSKSINYLLRSVAVIYQVLVLPGPLFKWQTPLLNVWIHKLETLPLKQVIPKHQEKTSPLIWACCVRVMLGLTVLKAALKSSRTGRVACCFNIYVGQNVIVNFH